VSGAKRGSYGDTSVYPRALESIVLYIFFKFSATKLRNFIQTTSDLVVLSAIEAISASLALYVSSSQRLGLSDKAIVRRSNFGGVATTKKFNIAGTTISSTTLKRNYKIDASQYESRRSLP
jgi:hypothetical protein